MSKFEMVTNAIETAVFDTMSAGTGDKIRESTTTDTARLFNAVNGSAKRVKDFVDKVVEIVDIVITSADIAKDFESRDDKGAEKISKPCVHLFTSDGTHISSVSNGIIKSTKSLFECGIIPTAETPLKIKFITVETKNGTCHSFELA